MSCAKNSQHVTTPYVNVIVQFGMGDLRLYLIVRSVEDMAITTYLIRERIRTSAQIPTEVLEVRSSFPGMEVAYAIPQATFQTRKATTSTSLPPESQAGSLHFPIPVSHMNENEETAVSNMSLKAMEEGRFRFLCMRVWPSTQGTFRNPVL